MKKGTLWIAAVAVVVVGAAAVLLLYGNRNKQIKISDVPGYSDFFNAPIEKIQLGKNIMIPTEFVVFSDEDLVAKWSSFFQGLVLKPFTRSPEATANSVPGTYVGFATVTVKGKDFGFDFYMKEGKINGIELRKVNGTEIIEMLYTVELTDCPFLETYNEVVKRHGYTTPWD